MGNGDCKLEEALNRQLQDVQSTNDSLWKGFLLNIDLDDYPDATLFTDHVVTTLKDFIQNGN